MQFLLATPRRFKWALNLYPPYWGTGIRVRSVADDFRQVVVTMGLRFYNRNAFGTHFGGSLAAMTDPFFTLMLIQVLGSDYRVIDSETRIEFLALSREPVTARFTLDDEVVERIRTATAGGEKHFETLPVEIVDTAGQAVARVEKKVYIRLRKELRPANAESSSVGSEAR